MRISISALLLLVSALCGTHFSYSQNISIDSTLAVYANKYPQERAYLHYDKSAYAPGETIWFKAYLMQGLDPAEGSKTLYVDWVDDKGDVLVHSVCLIVQSVSNGQFEIPEKYSGSVLHVRAYTKWMLNFDTAFLYQKAIHIVSKTQAATKTEPVISVDFFPEGGDAVAGVDNKIAFKATDQGGYPADIKGVIVSNTGEVQDSLRTTHDGMGCIFLHPKENASYTAKWKDAKEVEHTTPLPAIKPNGIALQVDVSGTKRAVNLSRTTSASDNLKHLYIVGTMQQNLVFKTSIDLSADVSGVKIIPTESLPTGILIITIFDANWNAIAERITFVNNKDYSFPTNMNVANRGLQKRGRNEIEITVPEGINANLSVAITDVDIETDSCNNIYSHFLLTSEIKGRVNNPAYYFSGNNAVISHHLDLVMLTNGWRRFKWEDVVKGKFPIITHPQDTSYLTISGQVLGLTPDQLNNKCDLLMLYKVPGNDKKQTFLVERIDTKGNFVNPDFLFFDTLVIHYQIMPLPKSGKKPDVRFMSNMLAAFKYGNNLSPFGISTDTAGNYRHFTLAEENASLMEMQKAKVLENVTVQTKVKRTVDILDQKYASGIFKSTDAYQFDIINDPTAASAFNVFDYLRSKVAGLQVMGEGMETVLKWRYGSPTLFIDESRTDIGWLSTISMTDVAYIKVFRPPFAGSNSYGGDQGAIAVYTRKGGDMQHRWGREGLPGNRVAGYTPLKQFYSPNYDSFQPQEKDVRTTLYWNPLLLTTPDKRTVRFTFYNNDISQSFRVVIEGISENGKLTRLEQIIK